jgi:hypothetical protein
MMEWGLETEMSDSGGADSVCGVELGIAAAVPWLVWIPSGQAGWEHVAAGGRRWCAKRDSTSPVLDFNDGGERPHKN